MSTRLAAILFTDIVGYTAMMQTDQAKAMAVVKQYEAVLKDRITHHNGELLQTYGDGSLSVFDSASAAVRCAKELQEQVRDQVPLRIGIHLGEITIDGEHIFGDGVNIASRIESMGVAGAVLVSSSVRQQIKNKSEFELESLGKVAFKNVAEPMTVYALANEGFAVPKREELKGKLAQAPDQHTSTRFLVRWTLLAIGLLIAGFFAWSLFQPETEFQQSEPSKPVIAVLPFRDLSPTQDQAFFCDGTAEEILNALAGLQGITVRGRGSSFSFKGKSISLKELGAQLEATVLLEGSIRRTKEKIRFNVQLIDVEDESTLWSQQYDQTPGDIFAIQEDIARKIIDQLQITLLPGENQSLLPAQTNNPLAHEWFLRGLEAFNGGARNADQPIEYLEKAISLDSLYYAAYVELGRAYFTKGIYGGGVKYFERAPHFWGKAVQINPNLPQAYYELTRYAYWYSASGEDAKNFYHLALERGLREPNEMQAYLAILEGNLQKGIHIGEEMLLNDPLSIARHVAFSRICLIAEAYPKVIEVSEKALAIQANQSSIMRHKGEALLHLGMYKEAEMVFEKLVHLRGYGAYGLAAAKFHLNKKEEAYKVLDTYKSAMSHLNIAYTYFAFGDTDSAFLHLDRAIEENNLGSLTIKNAGFIRPYQDDPRFQGQLKRLNLQN